MENRREVLLKLRDGLVDLFVVIARVLFFYVPGGDVAYGRALMVLHPLAIFACILLFFALPTGHVLRTFLAIASIFVVSSQWLLGGCVVTRAEQRLTGSKETIVDPFLKLAGLPADRNTRVAATLATGTTVCVVMLWSVFTDMLRAARVL